MIQRHGISVKLLELIKTVFQKFTLIVRIRHLTITYTISILLLHQHYDNA